MSESPYDMIDIIVNGEEIRARPTEFEMDDDDMPVSATSWETTCPTCSQLLKFYAADVHADGSVLCACSPTPQDVEIDEETEKKLAQLVDDFDDE